MSKAPIAVALDLPELALVRKVALDCAGMVDTLKIGLETFLRDGVAAAAAVRETDCNLFLDLKLHDIPNTVAGACRSVKQLEPEFLTVHAAGGAQMISAAANALPDTRITAVTLLTSLSQNEITSLGIGGSPIEIATNWAQIAVAAGARAVVCSPQEVAAVRSVVPKDILLVTPGVRPRGSALADQQRVATPKEALTAGADLLVIGRPITEAVDVAAAARAIAQEISG